MTTIDINALALVLAQAAAAEIRPRFRARGKGDIRTKADANDLVTAAVLSGNRNFEARIHQNILIVDRLFGAAELRLGSGDRQQTVRIVRIEQRQAAQPANTGESPS